MRQLITAKYQTQYWHDTHGDMFHVVKDIVHAKLPVPIDIAVISSPRFPLPLEGSPEEVISTQRIDALLQNLNKQYEEPTTGKLHFQLRGLAYYDEENFPEYMPLDSIATDEHHSPVGFTVRIIPFYQPYKREDNTLFGPVTVGPSGRYHARGLIDMHAETIVLPRTYSSLLAHEIGHGIFGYGHHLPARDHLKEGECIMNADNYSQAPLRFCGEDKQTLERLISLS